MYSILIIDDEPIVKIALRSILPWEEHGFFICGTASNGLEAVPLIEKHHPDIIITDLKMPEMDGLELIRFLKEKEYPGEILVLSNYEDFDSVRSALLLGAADYLLKIKIQPDTLLACLNKTTKKMQNTADRKDSILKTDITEPITDHLLSFFQGEESLDSFIERYGAEKFGFMKHSCAVCYVTFEKFLSNDAFSISANLLRDMPYKENLKNYEEARTTYQDFLHSEGHYKNDVAKTLTYIENNYMHRLTLSSISANVNLSTSYLCRVFKSEVGTSITSYLNNLRIRKAATLIKENTFSLKEISVMVGIDDQLYFSRLFKKCMGISPSEYGKRFHL